MAVLTGDVVLNGHFQGGVRHLAGGEHLTDELHRLGVQDQAAVVLHVDPPSFSLRIGGVPLSETEWRSAYEDGPYINLAVLCRHAFEDRDGNLNLIQTIDAITGDVPPEVTDPTIVFEGMLVVSVRAGRALGKHLISVQFESPTGTVVDIPHRYEFELVSPVSGHNLLIRLNLQFKSQGVYWFTILMDGNRISAVPVQVLWQ